MENKAEREKYLKELTERERYLEELMNITEDFLEGKICTGDAQEKLDKLNITYKNISDETRRKTVPGIDPGDAYGSAYGKYWESSEGC